MITIETQIDIATAPHEVWRVITAFDAYGDWNPLITKMEGLPAQGSAVTVHVALVGQATLPIKATITSFEPERELIWHSHLLLPGLLDRDHIIRIESNATGCIVRNIQTFDGTGAGVTGMLTEGAVRHGLGRMNDALKKRVETTGNN